jgi:hypothetical protein
MASATRRAAAFGIAGGTGSFAGETEKSLPLLAVERTTKDEATGLLDDFFQILFLRTFCSGKKKRGIETGGDESCQLGVGLDVTEIDSEVVGGVAKAFGPSVGGQKSLRLLLNFDAGGSTHCGNVFVAGESTRKDRAITAAAHVGKRIDFLARPNRARIDPGAEFFLFFCRKSRPVLGHLVVLDRLPETAFRGGAGNDDRAILPGGEGGAFFGKIEFALAIRGVVAFEAVTREDGSNDRVEMPRRFFRGEYRPVQQEERNEG